MTPCPALVMAAGQESWTRCPDGSNVSENGSAWTTNCADENARSPPKAAMKNALGFMGAFKH
jgi:hypothetical protein